MKTYKFLIFILVILLSQSVFAQINLEVSPTIKNVDVKIVSLGKEDDHQLEANIDRDATSTLRIVYNNILKPELDNFNASGIIKFEITDATVKDIVVFLGTRKYYCDYKIETKLLDNNDNIIKEYLINVSYEKTYSPFNFKKAVEKLGTGIADAWNKGFEDLKVKILSDKTTIEESLK